MPIVRAQVVLQSATGLPKDNVSNTFHFDTASVASSVLDSVTDNLITFYNANTTAFSVGYYISGAISRNSGVSYIKLYNLDDAEPRVPLRTTGFTLVAPGSTTQMPGQVALCLSFQAARVSGGAQARRRGRIYLGPLSAAAQGSGVNADRPATGIITTLLDAGETLYDNSLADNTLWTIYSPTGDTNVGVNNLWVDDRFDTQRRRLESASIRTTRVVA